MARPVPHASTPELIREHYRTLFRAWGRQHWWPAETAFEVIVGAYLTQNTAWTNVELALANLRKAGKLNVAGVRSASLEELEQLIRPAGYFRQKARSLKTFVEFLDAQYGGSLERMFQQPTPQLRELLLALKGVGPETADSILLYAGNHPVFVVDGYTRRIVERHGLSPAGAKYEEIRALFEGALGQAEFAAECSLVQATPHGPIPKGSCHDPSNMSASQRSLLTQIYNEMHGLIVGIGKNYCAKSQPRCQECPLKEFLP